MASDRKIPQGAWAGRLLIGLAGLIVTSLVTRPVARHVVELERHFTSGNWEITTDKTSIESRIRAEYGGDPTRWSISFVGGGARSFPLTPAYRSDTVEYIGQRALYDVPQLQFRSSVLPSTYGDFLSDEVLSLGHTRRAADSQLLTRLSRMLKGRFVDRSISYAETYRRGEQILSGMPSTSSLVKALDQFRDYDLSLGVFHAFQVFTIPPYDAADAVDAHGVTLEQSDRCLAQVGPIDSAEPDVQAYISRFPHAVEVELTRHWLSDELLDRTLANRSDVATTYFGVDGPMRVIPFRLWILLPDEVRVDLRTSGKPDSIKKWSNSFLCCRVTCGQTVVQLAPATVTLAGQEVLRGREAGMDPTLFAIVSRHRIAP